MKEPVNQSEIMLLRVLSLLLALLVWCYVMGGEEIERRLTVRLTPVLLPPGETLVTPLPDRVEVTLSGPRLTLWKLGRMGLATTLDLRGLTAGRTRYVGLEKGLRLPREVRVLRTDPAVLDIRLSDAGGAASPP